MESLFTTTDILGCVLSKLVSHTIFEKVLKLVEISFGGSRAHDTLIFNKLRRNALPNGVCTFEKLVKELSEKEDEKERH